MRTHAEWQHIPVIVLTAKDLTGEERRFLNGKVEQIVEKGSHSREQLMQLIRKVVVEGHGAGLPSAANRAGDGAPTG
jgi:CheY-like chemotaxis protein